MFWWPLWKTVKGHTKHIHGIDLKYPGYTEFSYWFRPLGYIVSWIMWLAYWGIVILSGLTLMFYNIYHRVFNTKQWQEYKKLNGE